jgi:hypothetical protein
MAISHTVSHFFTEFDTTSNFYEISGAFTNNKHAKVPWAKVVRNAKEYLEEDSIPPSGFSDPSRLRAEEVTLDWNHWETRQRNKERGLIFKKALAKDVRPHGFRGPRKGRGKRAAYVDPDSDGGDESQETSGDDEDGDDDDDDEEEDEEDEDLDRRKHRTGKGKGRRQVEETEDKEEDEIPPKGSKGKTQRTPAQRKGKSKATDPNQSDEMLLDEAEEARDIDLTLDRPLLQDLFIEHGFATPDWGVGPLPGPSGLRPGSPQPSKFTDRPKQVTSRQPTPAEPIAQATGGPDSALSEQSNLDSAPAGPYSPAAHSSTTSAMMNFLRTLSTDEPYQRFLAKLKPVSYTSPFFDTSLTITIELYAGCHRDAILGRLGLVGEVSSGGCPHRQGPRQSPQTVHQIRQRFR